MREGLRRAPLIVAGLLAAAPVVDGSFLVRGLVPLRQPLAPAPPAISPAPTPAPQAAPRFRCPMTVVEAPPNVDPQIAKQPPSGSRFTMRVVPLSCTAK